MLPALFFFDNSIHSEAFHSEIAAWDNNLLPFLTRFPRTG
jgi:hypothetical protein